jgi:hypothetical protein
MQIRGRRALDRVFGENGAKETCEFPEPMSDDTDNQSSRSLPTRNTSETSSPCLTISRTLSLPAR